MDVDYGGLSQKDGKLTEWHRYIKELEGQVLEVELIFGATGGAERAHCGFRSQLI